MKYLPIFLSLQGKKCLVVGGGAVATRKVELLYQAGAIVTIVALEICEQLQILIQQVGSIQIQQKPFQKTDIQKDYHVVIAATCNQELNKQISQLAQARHILVNVVDSPQLCTFIFPAIVDRSPLIIALSTGGGSPILARLLRAKLESLIPHSYSRLADFAAYYRSKVKRYITDPKARRVFWEKILQGSIGEKVLAGQEQEASNALDQALITHQDLCQGEVYLVGAGPGDPDLLTFRALRLMQQADIVLYDRLVSPEILGLVRREAERIYVGKKRNWHSLRQEEINGLLVTYAKEGKRVLRLKGGDPFIFGRGGEEIAHLVIEQIPFQVVPGISAASGCACYGGIPLTHRNYAHSCIFITGQLKDGQLDLNWQALVQPQQTIVVYMGLAGFPLLCQKLIGHGMTGAMPVALIQQGTTTNQKVFTGTLATLPSLIAKKEIQAPTLIIIGEVVKLHDQFAWFNPSNLA
ncbi:siroheme synthase CysG [Candidatus Nitrosacidococcus tergens]|uniref:Siroheme synthase n=1 Tax=Candidatus Nitrosacidococcus tergens TaxID=553981 RepID=A0A7G1Q957_9GAMM|nr:siroheme synthase CysG [Candidatus Nitrosacidococcus tergens]CAB1275707.1 Siroheme synthase [Includes: Uroporphyrinogen-III C-methyltransferase; Precorrin-2 dehydrogenase; Sirohydrochlorin ferrochelatase] [Candidatus Nitrosacidococcus tergens]